MPLTRIRQTAIGNDSITSAKLAHDLDLDGDFVRVPHGTTAQRPSSPVAGYMRFNTDSGTLEQWNTTTSSWQAIDSPPIITSLAYTGSATAADPAGGETTTLTGTNFKSGANVTIGGTSATSVTVVSTTSITFTTPVKTAGDYDVAVINANGLQASLTNGISYNGTPSFTTAAGNVGSVLEDIAMSTITIVAAEPDGGTLAYSITSGALPTGVSLGSANGQLTGTPNVNVTSNTTYNFTVTATDDENQTNARAFNLIVLRPIYATQLANSLKFEHGDSANLSRTISTSPTLGTKGTVSAWIKRSILGNGTGNNQYWFHSGTGTDNSGHMDLKFATTDVLSIGRYSDTPYSGSVVYRDTSAWMHIVVSFDSTSATAADRQMKVWVNGAQRTEGTFGAIGQNDVFPFTKSGNTIFIGKHATVGRPFNGYIADFHLIDGQVLTPTSFAEEYNGVWVPKAYSGSYGTNGFKLNFSNSSDLGNDVSGNNNDHTPNNFTVSDHVIDSPTNNFATLNPLTMGAYNTLNEGNLRLASVYGADLSGVTATQFFSSGKWYWEVRPNAVSTYPYIGIGSLGRASGARGMFYSVAWPPGGGVQTSGTELGTITSTNVGSYSNGDIIMFALDADARKLWWGENGTWTNSGNPVAGTGEVASWTVDEDVSPVIMGYAGQGVGSIFNFGQDSTFAGNETVASNADSNGIGEFQYSPPTNFLAVTSKNLSESTINTSLDDRPEDYFNTVTYTGNGGSPGTQSVNIGFQPDFVWLKSRTQTYTHYLFNSLSGDNKHLISNVNNGEATLNGTSDAFTFESTGFQVVATGGSALNESGQGADNMVSWSWKASGAPTATNSAGAGNVPTSGSVLIDGFASTSALAGTIAADKISANTKSKFSIVSFTGNGSGGATVAHGLGVTPTMVILKCTGSAANWRVYHQGIGTSNTLFLNSTNGQTADGDRISGVSSTTFTLSSGNGAVNGSGVTYIAYCFADVEGYSKIGFYQSSGLADGIFVHLGFKPAWVLIKSASAGRNWTIWDNVRGHASSVGAGNNPNTTTLFANTNGIETHNTGYAVDFTANGFKTRGQGGELNTTNEKMLFMAFAEDPFKYSEAE
jgi:hypothetical protein